MIDTTMQTETMYIQACRKRKLAARNDHNHLDRMMLRIDIKSMNGAATLRCTGRLVFGLEAETLRGIAKSRHERIIRVDLKGVEMVDATGLGLMVELQHWASNNRRELSFVNAGDFVQRLIALTRLDGVLSLPGFEQAATDRRDEENLRRAMIA